MQKNSSQVLQIWDRYKYEEFSKMVRKQGYSFAMYDVTGEDIDELSLHYVTHNYLLLFHQNNGTHLIIQNVHHPVPNIVKQIRSITSVVIEKSTCDLKWIPSLYNLTHLYIRNCKYRKLPDDFYTLPRLRVLWLEHAGIECLSENIIKLKGLEEIRIRHQKVKSFLLPEALGHLSTLKVLDITKSYINTLPFSLLDTNLNFCWDATLFQDGILLEDTQFENQRISLTLLQQPRDYIKQFLSGTLKATSECKIIFLGDGESGKTSLIERIIYDKFSENTPTDGIHIKYWNQVVEGLPIKLRFMDFGGQEIMHAMHRCFMTRNTVYVLVCESRNDSSIDRTAARWMENIKEFAGDCPVILALNKNDLNGHAQVDETNLRRINPSLQCVLSTSAKNPHCQGTKRLIEEIKKAALSIVDLTQGNAAILDLQTSLERMKKDYISHAEFRELCQICHVPEKVGEQSLDYFRDIGVCYYYTSSELDANLENLRILNPEWLTNGIYRLILRTRSNGILSHQEIKKTLYNKYYGDALPDKLYTATETEFILHIMRKFQISHSIEPGYEFIPLKLRKDTSSKAFDFNQKGALHLSWEASYIPNTVVHRLMIQRAGELTQDGMWRNGAIFSSSDRKQTALVKLADWREYRLDIYVQGEDKRQYLEELRRDILRIFSSLNLEPKEIIHFYWETKARAVPYIRVRRAFLQKSKEVQLDDDDVRENPNPLWILQEYHVSNAETSEINLFINMGNYSKNENSSITQMIDQSSKLDNQDLEILASKLSSYQINNTQLTELIGMLREFFEQNTQLLNMPELQEALLNHHRRKNRNIIRDFLADGSNLATILSFGATYGNQIVEFLKEICK